MTRRAGQRGDRRPGQRPLVAEPDSLGTVLLGWRLVAEDGLLVPRITVAQADPEVWVHPNICGQLRTRRCADGEPVHPDYVFDGDLLTIRAIERTLIYRIDPEPVDGPSGPLYYAHWPD